MHLSCECIRSKSTTLNTNMISLPCASVYSPRRPIQPCQCTLYFHRHIFPQPPYFLPRYWRSLSPILSIDSKEHFQHYFTPRSSYFDFWREISVFPPYSCQLLMGHFLFELSRSFILKGIHRRYTN